MVIRVQKEDADIGAIIGAAKRPGTGAIVLFDGIVRDNDITEMELEAYEDVAVADMEKIGGYCASDIPATPSVPPPSRPCRVGVSYIPVHAAILRARKNRLRDNPQNQQDSALFDSGTRSPPHARGIPR